MDFAQLNKLEQALTPPVVSVEQLADRTPRTLLYGYDTERHTWHVYLDEDGHIHRLLYDVGDTPLMHAAGPAGGCIENRQYVPNKRLCPESCDYEFCMLLRQTGESLPFTGFDAALDARRRAGLNNGYAGKTFAQLSSELERL